MTTMETKRSMFKAFGAPSGRSMLTSVAIHVPVLALLMLLPAQALLRSAATKKEIDIVFYRPARGRASSGARDGSGWGPTGGACTRAETETERRARPRPAWETGTPARSGGGRSRGPAATAEGWKRGHPGIQGQVREPGTGQDRAASRSRAASW